METDPKQHNSADNIETLARAAAAATFDEFLEHLSQGDVDQTGLSIDDLRQLFAATRPRDATDAPPASEGATPAMTVATWEGYWSDQAAPARNGRDKLRIEDETRRQVLPLPECGALNTCLIDTEGQQDWVGVARPEPTSKRRPLSAE